MASQSLSVLHDRCLKRVPVLSTYLQTSRSSPGAETGGPEISACPEVLPWAIAGDPGIRLAIITTTAFPEVISNYLTRGRRGALFANLIIVRFVLLSFRRLIVEKV